MSKHWNPEAELSRVDQLRPPRAWPKGATAGLVLVALSCAGLAALLYHVAGPRDVFAP